MTAKEQRISETIARLLPTLSEGQKDCFLAYAEALRDMPWVDQVEITKIRESDRYEMRAYMLADPKGLLRDVRPERIDWLGVFWRRARDVGPCTLVLYNTNKMEQAYRAKWGLEPMEEVRKDET